MTSQTVTKSQYPSDQQVKFLNLQAETESLLQQLKAIQQQRLASAEIAESADATGDNTSS